MAQTANRTLQYTAHVACSCAATAYTYTPGFDITALHVTLNKDAALPVYLSLAGAATTGDCYLSTGETLWWPAVPSRSSVVSFISTSSGAEVTLTAFG